MQSMSAVMCWACSVGVNPLSVAVCRVEALMQGDDAPAALLFNVCLVHETLCFEDLLVALHSGHLQLKVDFVLLHLGMD